MHACMHACMPQSASSFLDHTSKPRAVQPRSAGQRHSATPPRHAGDVLVCFRTIHSHALLRTLTMRHRDMLDLRARSRICPPRWCGVCVSQFPPPLSLSSCHGVQLLLSAPRVVVVVGWSAALPGLCVSSASPPLPLCRSSHQPLRPVGQASDCNTSTTGVPGSKRQGRRKRGSE